MGHVFTLCGGHILPIYDGCLTRTDRRDRRAARAGGRPRRRRLRAPHAQRRRGARHRRARRDRRRDRRRQRARRAQPAAADRRRRAAGAAWARRPPGDGAGRAATADHQGRVVGRGDAPDPRGADDGHPRRAVGPAGPGLRRDPGRPAPARRSRIASPRSRPTTCTARRRPAIRSAIERLAELLAGAERPVVMAGSGVYWDDAAATAGRVRRRRRHPGVHERRRARDRCPPTIRWRSRRRAASRSARPTSCWSSAPRSTSVWATAARRRSPRTRASAWSTATRTSSAATARSRSASPATSVACSASSLDALPSGTGHARYADWRARVAAKERESRERLDAQCTADDIPVSHYRWAAEIARARHAGHASSSATAATWSAAPPRSCRLQRPGQWLDPGPFGCLGVGPPFAIAAKLLHPDRRVLLIAGDGAFGLNGMEMETAVRFGLPHHVHHRQRRRLGPDPQPPALLLRRRTARSATSLPMTRFDLMVEALGGRGVLVREPEEIGPALERALALRRGLVHQRRCSTPPPTAAPARSRWPFDATRGSPVTALKITFLARICASRVECARS